jgi:TonB-dependent starch-binding outer membrane protein SusC
MIAEWACCRRWLLFVTLSFAAVPHAGAQERGGLTGHVLDQGTLRPISGASVTMTQSGIAAITDEAGGFTFLDLPAGPILLRIQHSGYMSQVEEARIPVGDVAVVELLIQPLVVALRGLVVTNERPEDTAAEIVISVRPEEHAMTVAEVLRRRVPGLRVGPSNGTLGAGGQLRFRGSTSLSLSTEPVIFMDGILVSRPGGGGSGDGFRLLNGISASQVVRIRIVRGPAAAVEYGESANGVIFIETRRGPN